MSREIFISHASADKAFVDKFVELMESGMGVPPDAYFYTSSSHAGVPKGKNFNEYMRAELADARCVLAFFTPAYLESLFCMMEVGAAWVLVKNVMPIVAGGVPFSSVSNTLGQIQGWDVHKEKELEMVRDFIVPHVTLQKIKPHSWRDAARLWERKVGSWEKTLLGSAKRVAAEEFLAVSKALEETRADLEASDEKNEQLVRKNKLLAETKDKAAVKAIEKDLGETGVEDDYKELVSTVRKFIPKNLPRIVLLHLMLTEFAEASDIDDREYEDRFNAALAERFIVVGDDGIEANWSHREMKPLRKAINQLERFLKMQHAEQFIEAYEEENEVSLDMSVKSFWVQEIGLP